MKKFIFVLLLSQYSILNTPYSFAQYDGDITFFSSQIHVVEINFSQVGWWDSLVVNKPLDKLMVAQVVVNGVAYDSSGVQFKGNSSYNAPGNKKPFKIDFNEYVSGQKFDGLKTINLNNCMGDPTLMREKFFCDFMWRQGFPAPRCTYAKLYLNGAYWGLYALLEQVDKTFLNQRFGNNEGNLFKGDAQGTLQWYGNLQSSYYGKYELKTNKTQNDWSDLVHLIDEINNTPSAQFYDSLEKVLNTDLAIDAWAANIIYSNLDSYQGSGHNYYIYHDTITGKFNWIAWDANETFGKFQMGMTLTQIENLSIFHIPSPAANRPLTDKMLQNNTYKSNYINVLCQLMDNEFTSGNLFPIIDSLYNKIKPDVYADTKKPYSNQDFETNINSQVMNNIPGLKSFITNRRASIVSQLAANGCFVGEEEFRISDCQFRIYPNPSNGTFTLLYSSDDSKSSDELRIYNVFGEIIYSKKILNPKSQILNLNVPAGIYFLKIGDAVSKISIVD